jgi:threonine dehydrogenase-like Zn-dependent dehydrogenase
MRATIMYKARDVRIENVPDAAIQQPTDAVIGITRACICGSDLWPYHDLQPGSVAGGQRMGHEAIGIVEEVGRDVRKIRPGQLVIMPFAYSDGSCMFCEDGLNTSCVHGGFFGNGGEADGAQAEALRVPQADGTLFPLSVGEDDALMPSLLTLSDVMCTGHHAAVTARVKAGHKVAVIGDGAVGLCGVIAAKRLGAEQVIILGRHTDRIALAKEFGATDVVSERGQDAVERVRKLTQGFGVHSVLECVGHEQAIVAALGIVRPGGAIGRVGVPHYGPIDLSDGFFFQNVTIAGGPAPVRAYIDELLPDVMEGRIEPGRVFDRTVGLNDVPDGYRAMDQREALKVMVRP